MQHDDHVQLFILLVFIRTLSAVAQGAFWRRRKEILRAA